MSMETINAMTNESCRDTNPQRKRGSGAWRSLLALRVSVLLVTFCVGVRLSFAADKGTITGTVAKQADKVTKVTAVERNVNKPPFPGRIDAATGRFTVPDLPVPGRYDCILEFGAPRLEGVNMKVPHSDYEEEQPLTAEDVKTIIRKTKSMNKFEDVVEILGVSGNIQHAAVLLNKLKVKPFYGSKPGEIVWRAELWQFERPEETWAKVQDELFTILYRVREQKAVYDKQSITFEPSLGGLELTLDKPTLDVGAVEPPADKPGVRLRSPDAGKVEEE